jgi:hypothetical protein
MRAKAFPLLEQTIEDWLRGYMLNRVNKYVKRITWVKQLTIDGYVQDMDDDWAEVEPMVREIASEGADHIMTGICEAFTFTDDEAVVPRTDEALLHALSCEFEKMHAMHAADTDGSLQQAFHSGKMSALLWAMWAAEGGADTGLVEPVIADAGKYERKSQVPCCKDCGEPLGCDDIRCDKHAEEIEAERRYNGIWDDRTGNEDHA